MEYSVKHIKYKNQVVFGKQSMPYFDRVPKEYQENEACFIFLNQGSFAIRAPENYLNFDEKSGVLAKCLNYFIEANKKQKEAGSCVEVIAILLYPALIEEVFDYDFSSANPNHKYNIKQVVIDELLDNYKRSINILIENPELVDDDLIKTKIKEFVLLICKSQNISNQFEFLSALFSPVTFTFRRAILQNLYSTLSIEEFAKLCHLSLSSFKRKFKKEFGESPKQFINAKKIEKARQLLKSNNQRITDISYDVGYESLASFNRNFKKHTGVSPKEYRMTENE